MPKANPPVSVIGVGPRKAIRTRILGVDPGIVATGYGVIEIDSGGSILYRESGVLRPRKASVPQRLQQIFLGLKLQIAKFNPQIMAVERPFFGKNVKSAMLLGQARGVALLAAAETGVRVQEYSPLEVKQAVVGYGRAAKEQVQAMIQAILHIPQELGVDAADALAAALCLAHSLPWQAALETGERGETLWRNCRRSRRKVLDLGDGP